MGKKKAEAQGLIAQLQEAIRDSGKSLYQLAKDSGVPNSQLYRFMRGERTLTLPAAEKICQALELGLVSIRKPRSRPKPVPKPQPEEE